MSIEHEQKFQIEEALSSFDLKVLQAVLVRQETLWHGLDQFECNRLFIVERVGSDESFISNESGRPYIYKDGLGRTFLDPNLFAPMVKTSSPETKRYILQPGKAYFMPANVPVKWHFSPGFVMTAFHFRLELLPGYNASDFPSSDFQVIGRANVPFLPPLSTTVSIARTMGDYMNITAAIYAYAATFMDHPADKLQEMIILRKKYGLIFEWIKSDFPALLTVPEMARIMQMSVETLSRHMKRDMGLSPKQYIDNNTLQCAIRELLYSVNSVKEIASLLGFSSSSYLSRFFKKHTGVSPDAYRRGLRHSTP